MGAPDLRIGTSGWNYPSGRGTWNGIFYPPSRGRAEGLRRAVVLRRALQHGRGELDVLRPAAGRGQRAWAERTPSGFEFSVKLYQKFTHPKMFKERVHERACRPAAAAAATPARRARAAQPVGPRRVPARHRSAGVDAASSARCSRSFRRASRTAPASRDYLAWLLERVRGLPRRRRAAAQQLERRPRRHAVAAERVRRGVGADRRAEVPLLDPAELPAERARASTTCGCTAGTRSSGGSTTELGGSLQLPLLRRRAAGVRRDRRTPRGRW